MKFQSEHFGGNSTRVITLSERLLLEKHTRTQF